MPTNLLRNIPSVNELLEKPALQRLSTKVSRSVVVGRVRTFLDKLRTDVQQTASDWNLPSTGELAEKIAQWIVTEERPVLRPVINATGIVLHTGLGRAPLAEEAIAEIAAVASGYASLEVDLASGSRSQRVQAVEGLLRELTGAEAATVVNNNAAATMLALAALSAGRETIVSRGELIEIGGSYRLPDVMAVSGARLREVGTTNKTRCGDYAAAIGEETGALLKVHPSNYAVVGFTEEASLPELIALGRKHSLPVIHDIGSGALIDYERFGLRGEPLATRSISAGADVVLFSGDKLLGGPQCGVIVGRRKYIEQIMKHPMMRAMRVGKLTLGALQATLRLYRDEQQALLRVPVLAMLETPLENLKLRAERLAPQLAATAAVAEAAAREEETFLGGGSLPNQKLATWCVAVSPAEGDLERLASRLRVGSPAVMGRVQNERLLLDLRTVQPSQDQEIVGVFQGLGGPAASPEE